MTQDKYFEKPIRGVLIKDGWYKIVETDDPYSLLDAEEIETPALKVGNMFYGCICDANARKSGKYQGLDSVVLRKKHLIRKNRYFGYVFGPVFIYLNKGLSDLDIEFIKLHIFLHKDEAKSAFLLVEDFQNMAYEKTDP